MRFGIIGTGIIAHHNCRALLSIKDIEIVALCNRTIRKGESFAREFGLTVPLYADYHEMVSQEKLDAVLINTPHNQHEEPFIFCAGKGLNIIVEKPLSLNYSSAIQMMNAAKENSIRAAVCHTQRYNTAYQAALDYVRDNDLGQPVSIVDNIHYDYFYEGRPAWFLDPAKSGGGVILNYGVHQLDRIHLFSAHQVSQVFCRMYFDPAYPDLDCAYLMAGEFYGGTIFNITCTAYPSPATAMTEVTFKNAIIRVVLFNNGVDQFGLYVSQGNHKMKPIPVPSNDNNQMYLRQMTSAINYFRDMKHTGYVSLDYAAYIMKLIDAMKTSYNTKSSISLDDA